jgi:hypothetical protein
MITSETAGSPKPVDFNRDILPILSDNCFSCHGPDEKQRMADLRLDDKVGIFADRGGYRVVMPGKSAESKLYQKISATDADMRMPPAYSNRTLTKVQIELIRRWIDEGAPYAKHWAFIAPVRPAVPEVKGKAWPRNSIDNFVLARLESEGLKPSPSADKATLLRRLTFDLTGLPPTLAELDSFLADQSPNAYEKRVDRLLASSHYGEHMAISWLDLARYADSHGYDVDGPREMWPWRDWVIKAYNRNMPFDQFTIKQLAGDLLPNATIDDRIATGFNRNHVIDRKPESDPQEYHVEYLVDRVSTTGTAWLGLTVGCARCHDHKYDPIKQKDFYRLFAFFNAVPERGTFGGSGNNEEPLVTLASHTQEAELRSLGTQIAQTLELIPENGMVAGENRWRENLLANMSEAPKDGLAAHYQFAENLGDSSAHGHDAKLVRGELAYGYGRVGKAVEFSGETEVSFPGAGNFDRDKPFALSMWTELSDESKEPIQILQKCDGAALWRGYEILLGNPIGKVGPGMGFKFRVVVRVASQWPDHALEVQTKEGVFHAHAVRHLVVTYDGSGAASGVKLYVDSKLQETEILRDRLDASFATAAPLTVGSKNIDRPFAGMLDDLRIYNRALSSLEVEDLAIHYPARMLVTELAGKPVKGIASLQSDKPPAEVDIGMLEAVKSKEQEEAEHLSEAQTRLNDYYLSYAAPEQYRKAYAKLKELRAQRAKLKESIPSTMVMDQMAHPRDTFMLGRGQFDNPGEKVTPGVPAFLSPLPKGAALNRLTLARWLVDPANPLTARVAVNRYWQSFFGKGIVKTSENFGMQGDPPSHPELLDWLATEFIRNHWDIKYMQRLIVTSATYRQSSRVTPELAARDPENRLLARGPRVRLSAEEIRDNALATGGLLDGKIGGPSVYPYQPDGIWEAVQGGRYPLSTGRDLYRRSLYTVWKRAAPPPSMILFDAPDRQHCVARRNVSNTPLQALVLLDDPTFVEASRALAQRTILTVGTDPVRRIDYAFRLATDRNPDLEEQKVLLDLVNRAAPHYKQDNAATRNLLSVGEIKPDPKIDPADLAAWTTVTRIILNMDETITKE